MSDLTDICEALRFVEDRSKRSSVLESLLMGVDIPECVYLPLCKSTEPFQRVLKITANEAKAFSTKVRCVRTNYVLCIPGGGESEHGVCSGTKVLQHRGHTVDVTYLALVE